LLFANNEKEIQKFLRTSKDVHLEGMKKDDKKNRQRKSQFMQIVTIFASFPRK
jgi:hypothetical protein